LRIIIPVNGGVDPSSLDDGGTTRRSNAAEYQVIASVLAIWKIALAVFLLSLAVRQIRLKRRLLALRRVNFALQFPMRGSRPGAWIAPPSRTSARTAGIFSIVGFRSVGHVALAQPPVSRRATWLRRVRGLGRCVRAGTLVP
jgi:hypothetical protein